MASLVSICWMAILPVYIGAKDNFHFQVNDRQKCREVKRELI
jgi:hypothetical protein